MSCSGWARLFLEGELGRAKRARLGLIRAVLNLLTTTYLQHPCIKYNLAFYRIYAKMSSNKLMEVYDIMTESEVKDFLNNSYVNCVRKLSRVVTLFYDAKLAAAGLGICYPQLFMLMAIKGYGEIQKQEFCKITGHERTTFIRNMQLLEKLGYVNIYREEKGRKTYLISKCYELTEKGERELEVGYNIWKEFQEKVDKEVMLSGYADHKDLESLKHTCNEIVFALQAVG